MSQSHLATHHPHSKDELSDAVVEKVQDLIQVNLDSAKACETVAKHVDQTGITRLFGRLADERRAQAEELQRIVRLNEEDPEDSGTKSGGFRNSWLDLRATINAGNTKLLLEKAESNEDRIRDEYESTLKEAKATPVNDLLMKHLAHVKESHDQVRALRDMEKH